MDWDKKLESINVDGIDGPIIRKLSATDREVIRRRYECLKEWKGRKEAKTDIIEFSRELGATEEEIKLDILPSLGL